MLRRACIVCHCPLWRANFNRYVLLQQEMIGLTRTCCYRSLSNETFKPNIATTTKSTTIRWFSASNKAPLQRLSKFFVPPDLVPHVRDCLWEGSTTDASTRQVSTGFLVAFIGTGSSAAVPNRSFAATVLRFGMPNTYLFDVGEGTLRQMASTRVKYHFINKIFISHMHGDHIFGLPSLVLAMQVASMAFQPEDVIPLEIYGPVGLYSYLISSLAAVGAKITVRSIKVGELVGTVNESRLNNSTSIFTVQGVTRHSVPSNGDGTWTIHETGKRRHLDSCAVRTTAAEVVHLPGMPCFGYCVEEVEMQRPIDMNKARALGLTLSPNIAMLRSATMVLSDDGKRWVDKESVLGPLPNPRKFVLVSDAFAIPPVMARLCRGADVLVHEATLPAREAQFAEFRGHSTPAMAGRFAQRVNPKVLVLNHFGPHNGASPLRVARDAMAEIKNGSTRVIAASDFMEIMIPPGGFNFDSSVHHLTPDDDPMKQSSM